MSLMDLKARVLEAIDPREFYSQYIGKFKPGTKVRCFHPEHEDPNPSLSIALDGRFKCHGCGIRGSSLVQAYEYIEGVDFKTALRELASKYLGENYVPEEKVELWHQKLKEDKDRLSYLAQTRGLDNGEIDRFKLGWNGVQYTIPITDESGLYVNVRKYRPNAKQQKVTSYKKGFGTARLWPLDALARRDVYLVEGETDCLCGRAHKLNCITSTGGASHWKNEWSPLFKGHRIVIIGDNDKAGRTWANSVGQALVSHADAVKVVIIPIDKRGADLTDYLMTLSIDDFNTLVEETEYLIVDRTPASKLEEKATFTTLADASKAELYYKRTEMDCVVSGKELSPYLAPRIVKVDCGGGIDACETCHRKPKGFTDTLTFDLESESCLRLVDVSDRAFESYVRHVGKIPKKCEIELHHLEKANVEKIALTPSLDEIEEHHVNSVGYYLGHGIEVNRPYRMEGFLIPEPAKQRAVHIVTKASSVYDALDSFEVTKEDYGELSIFQTDNVAKSLKQMYEDELPKITQIVGRGDVHEAIDLVYHSPLSFEFNNEVVRKGWLECLVFGDTQQGKTYIASKLTGFYKLGTIATGEAATFAGLVGGLQKVNDRWMVSWGLVARHDRRLVFIDEASGLSYGDIERMSRVRSEGKAELVKVVTQVTNARCRLVWLSNPRSGTHLKTYTSGVDALRELIGKSEDISRFDYCLAIVGDEVDERVLNKRRAKRPKLIYSPEAQRKLILWCWSRGIKDIKFSANATKLILKKYSVELPKTYSGELPLVQKENIRVKIARVAAAIAGRVFSTKNGKDLLVKEDHVEEAVKFLKYTYDKPALGYNTYSVQVHRANTLKDEKEVEDALRSVDNYQDLLEGLFETTQLTPSDIADFAGIEKWEAKELVGILVRQRAIIKKHAFYRKRPAFISFLGKLRAQILT